MARPWEEGLPEGVSRLSRIFNDPNEKMARLGQGCMYDPPSRPSSASPRGRPQSASPRYYGAQPASPRQQERPGSAHIGGRPQSPRAESPRGSLQQSYGQAPGASPRASPRTQGQSYGARATQGQGRARPQSAAAPASPRMRELEETNDALRRSYRLAQLEQAIGLGFGRGRRAPRTRRRPRRVSEPIACSSRRTTGCAHSSSSSRRRGRTTRATRWSSTRRGARTAEPTCPLPEGWATSRWCARPSCARRTTGSARSSRVRCMEM